MDMKALAVLGLATVIAIGSASAADARQGCGAGFHRNMRGRCVPNLRQRNMRQRAEVFVVGRYYPGRGYWYDGRWWHHRYRHHNIWRYR
jgi:hypothetical protein